MKFEICHVEFMLILIFDLSQNLITCKFKQILISPFGIKGRVHILEDRSLRIDNVSMEDIGEYSCEADNAVGSVVSSGTLIVYCKFLDFFI